MSLLLLLGVAMVAHADVIGCNTLLDGCGGQQDPPNIGGGSSSSEAATSVIDGTNQYIRVQENHETQHWYGWATDNTADSGTQYTSFVLKGMSVGCPGSDLQEFYSNSFINGTEFADPEQGSTYHC